MPIVATYIVPHPPLIIPSIGKGEEQKIKDTVNAFHDIAKDIAKIKPDTIIISSPHAQLYRDYFHISPLNNASGNFSQFGAPQTKFLVNYDESLVNLISSEAIKQDIPAGTAGNKSPSLDHGTMVPLHFINQYYNSYKLVRISPSGLTPVKHYKLGKLIQSVIPKDKKVVWVASGDLSHKLKEDGPYGLSQEGPIFDKKITEIITSGNLGNLLTFDPHFIQKAAECGLNSFTMMAGVLDGYQVTPQLLSYEGPFGVGYAVAKFIPLDKDKSRMFDQIFESNEKEELEHTKQKEDPYVSLARQSLEYYVKNKKTMKVPSDLIDDLINNKAGVFVSIHKHNQLRGCVGTIDPTTKSIALEIIHNAVSAGIMDTRFRPIKKKELPYLHYSVDVLFPAEPITSIEQLDIKKYGVIVYQNRKSGLLLPNLDGITSVEQQVKIAKQKANIYDDQPFTMERFEVVRHY